MQQLCSRIETERDHIRFLHLIRELNDLLARAQRKLGSAFEGPTS